MSVLIKGMEMPKNCWNCPFFHTSLHNIGDDELLEKYTCLRTGERTDENVTGYMKNCPLVELPQHGRLISAELLKADFTGNFIESYPTALVHAMIDDAPTIVPASEGIGNE